MIFLNAYLISFQPCRAAVLEMVQVGKMLPGVVVPLCCVFLGAQQLLLPTTAFVGEEPVPVPPSK